MGLLKRLLFYILLSPLTWAVVWIPMVPLLSQRAVLLLWVAVESGATLVHAWALHTSYVDLKEQLSRRSDPLYMNGKRERIARGATRREVFRGLRGLFFLSIGVLAFLHPSPPSPQTAARLFGIGVFLYFEAWSVIVAIQDRLDDRWLTRQIEAENNGANAS